MQHNRRVFLAAAALGAIAASTAACSPDESQKAPRSELQANAGETSLTEHGASLRNRLAHTQTDH